MESERRFLDYKVRYKGNEYNLFFGTYVDSRSLVVRLSRAGEERFLTREVPVSPGLPDNIQFVEKEYEDWLVKNSIAEPTDLESEGLRAYVFKPDLIVKSFTYADFYKLHRYRLEEEKKE